MADFVLRGARMTMPRQIHPGRFYLVSRRCTQREFLLRPDAATNNAFRYCLIVAAQLAGVEILLSCVMSNHHHTVVYDRHGNLPVFTEHLHKLVAKSQNALRGRWENFWAGEQGCNVELISSGDVLDKLVYAATNPVKDFLVDTVAHWPGVNTLADLLADRPLEATRPRHFFDPEGHMPTTVTLRQVIPPELGVEPARLRSLLREGVHAVEVACAEQRNRAGGRRVVGRRAILAQDWRDRPSTIEPRRNLRPRIAARDPEGRIVAILEHRAFVRAYRAARARWLAGLDTVFPVGTYWLRRFAAVPIATA